MLSACLGTSINGSTGASIGSSGASSTGGSAATSTGGSTNGGGQGCTPACNASQACVAGSCVDLCALVGQARCDGGCANLRSDDANCGTCGVACPLGQGCVDGGCQGGSGCQPGYKACDLPDGGLFCTDPSIDPENCGGCGVSCGTEVCRSGGCVCFDPLTTCPIDAGVSSGDAGLVGCFDLNVDPAACGACGHACVSCEQCRTGMCTPQSPLTLSGYLLSDDAGASMYPGAQLVSGDVNGDGISDLVSLNFSNTGGLPTLGWSFGIPDGGFAAFQYLSLQAPGNDNSGNSQIVSADFDRDGFADVVLTYTKGNQAQLSAYLFRGSASGLAPVSYIGGEGSNTDHGTGVGDINSDGWEDLVIAGDDVRVFLNLTDGGFLQSAQIANPLAGYAGVRFAIADLDGDGLPDLIVPGEPGVTRTQVAYQLSDGGFSAWIRLAGDPSSSLVAGYGSRVVVASADQIGLVSATSDGGVCGSLSSPVVPSPGFLQIAADDLNHDGKIDVVALGNMELASFLRTPTGWDSSPIVALPPGTNYPNFLAVLADGRVAVSDPPDQRILIFDDGCGP